MYYDFEITKREVIASVSIMGLMLVFGMILSDMMSDSIKDSNERYNKAIHIQDQEIFEYAMETNVGDAFIYGDLIASNPVSYDTIDGEYMFIKQIREEYTMHSREVSYPCGDDGESTCYETEYYWTWDEVDREYRSTDKVVFSGAEFEFDQFSMSSTRYIDTIEVSSHVRYQYYGIPKQLTGTIFAHLKNNNIGDKVHFYDDLTTEQAYHRCVSGYFIIYIFWAVWMILTVIIVLGFYYLDNAWLY